MKLKISSGIKITIEITNNYGGNKSEERTVSSTCKIDFLACVSRFFLGLEFASLSISQDLSTKFNNVDKQVRYIANDLREVSRESDVTQHLIPFWILLWRP